jgi:hypothetical protein
VTNVLPRTDLYDDPLKSSGTGVLRFDEKSKFFISFDERPGTDWALDTPDKIGDILVQYDKGQVTKNSPTAVRIGGPEGKPWQWEIRLNDMTLGPDEHLEIILKLTASGSYGHSNLYLDYRNVPGYWDGRFTNVIEKSPLTYHTGKIGIGEAKPQAELEIKGRLKVDSLVIQPPTIHTLKLKPGWEVRNGTPKCFKDNQGIVHLTAELVFQFPKGSNERQKRDWLAGKHRVLDLPSDCLPALQSNALIFPAHARCIFGRLWEWHVLVVTSEGYVETSLPFFKDELMEALTEVNVYLDGISYLAKN